jgi:D-inositol-3-phosphate glycosyltransferase
MASPASNLVLQKTHSRNTDPTLSHQAMPIVASGVDVTAFARPLSQTTTRKAGKKPAKERQTVLATRRNGKKRLIWIGDAGVPTGFATVTHAILHHLHQTWDVIVSGVNYDGGQHDYPYTILPACDGGDMWGIDRFADLCAESEPDVVVINNDWWNVAAFLKHAPTGVKIVGYMPVDAAHLNPSDMRELAALDAAVWYTEFGHDQAGLAGFEGKRHVIPHGIDATVWRPADKVAARQLLGLSLPENAFLVGNVNRNQPRKRLDVSIRYFANWIHGKNVTDAWLLLHCAKQDVGWDLERVASFYGVQDRLVLTGPEELRQSADAFALRHVYSALDVQISTTLGEGWGLTTMEGMACGIPQVVPDWAALGEWAKPACKVPCSTQLVHPEINTVGALPDEAPFMASLDTLYRDAALRAHLSEEGRAYLRDDRFQWSSIAAQFDTLLSRLTTPAASARTQMAAVLRSAA